MRDWVTVWRLSMWDWRIDSEIDDLPIESPNHEIDHHETVTQSLIRQSTIH
jgi:hypothetical protein